MISLINKIKKIINRETILYAVVGIGTSILNILLFQVFLKLDFNYRSANIITLIVVKLVAYICNKNLVFQSHTENFVKLCMEFGRFLIARGATMLLDYFGLIFLVEILHINKVLGKCIVTGAVIIINYFVGKKHVFKNGKTGVYDEKET